MLSLMRCSCTAFPRIATPKSPTPFSTVRNLSSSTRPKTACTRKKLSCSCSSEERSESPTAAAAEPRRANALHSANHYVFQKRNSHGRKSCPRILRWTRHLDHYSVAQRELRLRRHTLRRLCRPWRT